MGCERTARDLAALKAHGFTHIINAAAGQVPCYFPNVFDYLPLHLSEFGQRLGGKPGDCPVTEDISDRLLRLPLFHGLSEADQADVVAAVTSFEAFD